jgi:hypothetical protein
MSDLWAVDSSGFRNVHWPVDSSTNAAVEYSIYYYIILVSLVRSCNYSSAVISGPKNEHTMRSLHICPSDFQSVHHLMEKKLSRRLQISEIEIIWVVFMGCCCLVHALDREEWLAAIDVGLIPPPRYCVVNIACYDSAFVSEKSTLSCQLKHALYLIRFCSCMLSMDHYLPLSVSDYYSSIKYQEVDWRLNLALDTGRIEASV